MRTLTGKLGFIVVVGFSPLMAVAAPVCGGIKGVPGTNFTLELVVAGLVDPVDVTAPLGDVGRLFIVEKPGRIRILRLADDTLVEEPFLDIGTRVWGGSERGLLGLAFHPDYAENGFFYVNYSQAATPTGATVIGRFSVTENPDVAEPDSEVQVLVVAQPASNHNGGQIAFGPNDGFLYIGTGDGGNRCDSPQRAAQDPQSLLGKMLRIDVDEGVDEEVDGGEGSTAYGIPEDNPFQGDADLDGAIRDEIWAFGLRNPWRYSFDSATGDLYIGDVGQDVVEEIDYQPASSLGGENYEWVLREGTESSTVSSCTIGPIVHGVPVPPILDYRQRGAGEFGGCTVIAGVVYRGCVMPDLHGTFFFADHCGSGGVDWVRSFDVSGIASGQLDVRDVTESLAIGTPDERVDNISSFGTDGRGEVYICELRGSNSADRSGKVFRVVPLVEPPPFLGFRRGDSNGDREIDLGDPIATLGRLFLGTEGPLTCEDALDADDDGRVLVTDPIYLLNFLFLGGPALPTPFPGCGMDATADLLDCTEAPCP